MESGIYWILNEINNKIYIGSAVNIKNRWSYHISELKLNKHKNKHLQSAYNKYGEDNFKFEVIEYVEDVNKLIIREQYYMDTLGVCNDKIGYNIIPIAGSNLGYKHTDETKLKLSKLNKGKKLSEEHKAKMSKSHMGHKVSEETRQKLSKIHKGRVFSDETKKKMGESSKGNKYNLGKRHSDEVKLKMSLIKRGKKVSDETKCKMSKAQKLNQSRIIIPTQDMINDVKNGLSRKKFRIKYGHSHTVWNRCKGEL